jgi:hypothetical protein
MRTTTNKIIENPISPIPSNGVVLNLTHFERKGGET